MQNSVAKTSQKVTTSLQTVKKDDVVHETQSLDFKDTEQFLTVLRAALALEGIHTEVRAPSLDNLSASCSPVKNYEYTQHKFAAALNTAVNDGVIQYLMLGDHGGKDQLITFHHTTTVSQASQFLAQKIAHCENEMSQMYFLVDNLGVPLENYNKPLFEELLKLMARLRKPIILPLPFVYVSKLHLVILERELRAEGKTSVNQLWKLNIATNRVPNDTQAVQQITRDGYRSTYDWKLESREAVRKKICIAFPSLLANHFPNEIVVDDYPLFITYSYAKLQGNMLTAISHNGLHPTAMISEGKRYEISKTTEWVHELGISRGATFHLSFATPRTTSNLAITDTKSVAARRYNNNTECEIMPLGVNANLIVPSSVYKAEKGLSKIVVAHDEGWSEVSNETYINNNSLSVPTAEKLIEKAPEYEIKSIQCRICYDSVKDNRCCPKCSESFCGSCITKFYAKSPCCPICSTGAPLYQYERSETLQRIEHGEPVTEVLRCGICRNSVTNNRLCKKCKNIYCKNCISKYEKCIKCGTSDLMYDRALNYYEVCLEDMRSLEDMSSFRDTKFAELTWKSDNLVPKTGSREQHQQRTSEIFTVTGMKSTTPVKHMDFSKCAEKPILRIEEPPEYFCARSQCVSYYDPEAGIWTGERIPFVERENGVEATLPHFSDFGATSTRIKDVIYMDPSFFETTWDYDFRQVNDAGNTFQRGSKPYKRPTGWYRKGMDVSTKYTDRKWLESGTQNHVWPVAYHGTKTTNIAGILANGLQVGGSAGGPPVANGTVHGRGIYVSPNPDYSKNYATPVNINGKLYRVMFQTRVNPSAIKEHTADIWTLDSPSDIRPYGVCICEERV